MNKIILLSIFLFTSLLSISQTVIVSDNTWKGIGSLTSVPGNAWLFPGFNDSAWPVVEGPNAGNVIPVVPGSQSIWVLPYSDTAYMRKTFIVPVADSYSGSISINADNEFTLYFNGASQGFFNNWMGGPYVFNISPSLQGCVENVVAVMGANWGGPYGASLNTTLNVTNPLNTPIADTAVNITCTSFTAVWDSVPTATNYLLDVSTDPNFSTFYSVYHDFNVLDTFANITGTNPGTIYYYRLRAERPPLVSCYSNVITVTHQFSSLATSNSPICEGETILLNVNSTDPTATFSWSGPNGFSSNSANPSLINSLPNQSGNYIVTITLSGCTPFDDTVSVLVNPIYTQNLSASFCNGSSITIQSQNISIAGNYSFSLVSVNGCDSILNYTVVENLVYDLHFFEEICYDQTYLMPDASNQTAEGIYPFLFTSLQGCDSTVTIHLNVLGPDSCTLIIPNVFSPNGDLNNDLFVVQGLLGDNNKLEIYNRWGQLVYSTPNYLNNWNGKSSDGKELPEGVYYFILTTEDETISRHLTLLR
jgi:gliding motility-associated-like protein